MQMDESTDISHCSHLPVFVPYVCADAIKEFISCEPLLEIPKDAGAFGNGK
jgi:hypothetical protein